MSAGRLPGVPHRGRQWRPRPGIRDARSAPALPADRTDAPTASAARGGQPVGVDRDPRLRPGLGTGRCRPRRRKCLVLRHGWVRAVRPAMRVRQLVRRVAEGDAAAP